MKNTQELFILNNNITLKCKHIKISRFKGTLETPLVSLILFVLDWKVELTYLQEVQIKGRDIDGKA